MTEKLVDLPVVTQLSPNVVRILGGNPGKFTLQGTNTYLISPVTESKEDAAAVPCILIDTGEGMESYTKALRGVLEGQDSSIQSIKRHITDIILTHRHHDHVGGLPSVLELLSQTQSEPPRLHKFSDPATDEALFARLKQLPSNVYQSHKALDGPVPIRPLQEGDVISVGEDTSEAEATAKATAVQVVHSPGHTTDSICLYFSPEKALFTADHVLGQGTSVFENLGSYLSSLTKCLNLLQKNSASEQEERLLYPGHGPVIETGKKALQDYLSHRLERENQVLALLAKQPSNSKDGGSEKEGGWTIEAIVSELYSNYPEHLYPAAARGIFLHLEKLASPDEEAIQRGVVGRQKQGRRVECVGTAAGKDGMTPKMPSGDSEWFHIMELKWRLLDQTV